MSEKLENLLLQINEKIKINKSNLNSYWNIVLLKSNKVISKSKYKIEIKKCELELKRKYQDLGIYITEKCNGEQNFDFTYDEKFNSLINKISNLKKYIDGFKKK